MERQGKTPGFSLEQQAGYFTRQGVNVIVFEDIYPEGHQGGVSLLMHGERIAANGDVRFEPASGQWQQTEYVLGGGSSRFMFLVLAVQQLLGGASPEGPDGRGNG